MSNLEKDQLKELLEKVENWCAQNIVSIFYGEIDDNKTTEVSWNQRGNSDWKSYLQVLKDTGSKVLVIEIEKNELNGLDDDRSNYLETLDEDEKKNYHSALATIKKTKGQIASLIFYFFVNNTCYQYYEFAEWMNKYNTISEAYDFDDDDGIGNNNLSENEIDKIARKIVADKKYQEAKDRFSRRAISDTLILKDDIENLYDTISISRKAEEIFNEEIKPQIETAFREKVLNLKAKGLKKVEIASKLKITRDAVNKYYYADNDM